MRRLEQALHRFHQGYVRFVEKQGFFVIVGVCVAVVAGTALWTRREQPSPVRPTPPVTAQSQQAAQLMQQQLAEAATPSPSPTPAPVLFDAPLPNTHVVQGFDGTRLTRLGQTGLWVLHDACDLKCARGDVIRAIADGVVTQVDETSAAACSVTVDHGSGLLACYGGMSALTALAVGDPVEKGRTVGFAGDGAPGEEALGPHLHLRVTRNGHAIDPTILW